MDPVTATRRPVPPHVVGVLAVAVLAVSSAAVIVRAIDTAQPLALAFWRTLLVAVLLAPALRRVTRRDVLLVLLSGSFLAAHFATWFASLEHISVMRSTVLVCLGPVWTAALEWGTLGRRPRAWYWVGLAVALPGIALLTGADFTRQGLRGDLLALSGGAFGAVYFVLGRSVRPRVGIGTYACLTAAAAAAWLFPVTLVTGTALTGFPPRTWALIAALALGPQLLGHNGFNYSLRYVPAATVAALSVLEPVGATVLAAILLHEIPTPAAVLGGALTVLGVLTASWQRSGRQGQGG